MPLSNRLTTTTWACLLALALAAVAATVRAADPRELRVQDSGFNLNLEANYSSGDYGTNETTTVWTFPFSLAYETPHTYVVVSIPYVVIDGPGTLVGTGGGTVQHPAGQYMMSSTTSLTGVRGGRGGMGRPAGGAAGESARESGLGDITLSGTYSFFGEDPRLPLFNLTGRVKFPTANEDQRLGSGEFDYAVEGSLSQDWRRWVFYGAIGYEILGDPPGVDLNNVFYGSAGGAFRLPRRQRIGLNLDAAQAASDGADNPLELSAYYSKRLTDVTGIYGYLLKGLSDGSPDWGGGISLSFYF